MILQKKVALVTGAARNVGRGVALRLAREGAHVLLNDIDRDAIARLVSACKDEGLSVSAAVADITDEASVKAMIDTAVQRHGSLDILVNNAVIHTASRGEHGPFLKVTTAGWREFISRNLDAVFFTSQQAARVMARQKHGSIINISSNGAVRPHRQRIAYDTMKGAVESFTLALAVDLAPWQVRVNALRPCVIADSAEPGTDAAARQDRLAQMNPMGRIARPADLAWAVVFLSADEASYITGQILNIDGGMLTQSRPPQLELESVVGPEDIDL
jgi:NAD(P)-dependent dehydrogenase (short-subunit alcohol dehydrogenase family)